MATLLLASVDGEVLPPERATISIADDGLLRGDGAFEMVRVYDGVPFALEEHLDRLERSAAGIELPLERPLIEREFAALIEAAAGIDCNLRIVLTRGGQRLLLVEPPISHPETLSVASVTYSPSGILAGVKSLSYGANVQATRTACRAGADEALLVRPDGIVLEAPTSSIFWASPQGGLRTPSLEVGILNSITRAFIVAELEVEEGAWPLAEVLSAPEAFLASTTREVQALAEIDGEQLPEAPGALTLGAVESYSSVVRRGLG
jgi:branched-chain amino acid aminotransferase